MGLLRRVKSILRDLLRLAVLLAAMVTAELCPAGCYPFPSLLVSMKSPTFSPIKLPLRDRRLVRLFTMSPRTWRRQLPDTLERERSRGMLVEAPLMLLRKLLLVVGVDG